MTWDEFYLGMAAYTATKSKDPSSQVGAVIVRPDRTVASLGFNGFPRGMSDAPELYADRDSKYQRVIHAEMNAVLSAHEPVHGHTLYCSLPSCERCCVHMIQAGITRVVWPMIIPQDFIERWHVAIEASVLMFREAGVEIQGWSVYP